MNEISTTIKPDKNHADYPGWVLKLAYNAPTVYRHPFGGSRPALEIGVHQDHKAKALSKCRMAVKMTHHDTAMEGPVGDLAQGFYKLSDFAGKWLATQLLEFQNPA